jgi:hypothetical protein
VRELFARSHLAERVRQQLRVLSAYALPHVQFLEGETTLLEIRQAPYRDAIPRRIFAYWWLVLLLSGLIMLLVAFFEMQAQTSLLLTWLVLFLPISLFAWAAQEKLHYEQWRVILTDRRTILFMPDPKSWWRVDTIRMGKGKISVVDTNFSRSPWWGLFQTWSGARDLVISMSGYAFKEGHAEVQGGLIIPDVMAEDVKKLEESIFKK